MPYEVFNLRAANCPEDARYIGRGSIAGNPYKIGVHGTRDEVCDLFEQMCERHPRLKQQLIDYCRGHDLKCFCKPLRCHGDYLVRISNCP